MKYAISTKYAVLAVSAALLVFSNAASAQVLDVGVKSVSGIQAAPGMRQLLAMKRILSATVVSDDGGSVNSTLDEPIVQNCSYISTGAPGVTYNYTSSYLGYTFYTWNRAGSFYTPYQDCFTMARSACDFIHYTIGVPYPLDVNFVGNIVNTRRQCGSF